ncbi:IS3 family transposase [Streptomyces albireticuli]|uniref:IS3 family transposase n=1 Tax=Streptomyces albireticuli TaxID=1940 RepID=UPI001E386F10|nr:IS3 family transposase [Streptomyces albireticuli]MCD9146177.1 IS3 family transposase [Streptomyces albireticuli]MCD9166293.1 IS3 family transposase [Streptomyces albireticuli]MCD9196617.1 IS3 family transposase [Streptomyces albireticuli]
MPKKIDSTLRSQAVRLVMEHRAEYSSERAAHVQVAESLGVSRESVRRWVTQHEIDSGQAAGVSTDEREELRRLRAENKRLREVNEVLKSATNFLRGGTRPPKPLIVAFIDEMKAAGHAVESILIALNTAGLKIAARTLRAWCAPAAGTNGPAARTVSDALVEDAVRSLAFTTNAAGQRVLAPEGLYGRRKILALIRRTLLPEAGFGAVDRAMRSLGLAGVVRGKRPRTTVPNPAGTRAADLLNRDFTAPAPDQKWITDFTYVRTYQSFTYVAFIVDCFSQKIVGWHASLTRDVELVDVPLRMALWRRSHEGTPVGRDQLIHHSDAGSQYTSVRFTEHLKIEGIRPSIGSVGDAYDNALMETINGLYKSECIRTKVFHDGPWRTVSDVEYATAAWVEWYNNRRLHSSLGMTSPTEYEAAHYADTEPVAG